MAVTIYRYRPPEIAVTLTAGGTLAASTTYYIGAYFNKQWVYNGVFSIFSNIVSFTTDAVNRSISIYWKVTVPIQSFENGGASRIRVRATNHCLTTGDTLIIESGIYAGSYTVTTWENYNSFLITGTFTSSYSTTFRVETLHNSMSGMMMYMHTVTPFSGLPSAGTWQGVYNRFSHYPWNNGYTTNNFAITAGFTTTYYGQQPEIQGTAFSPIPQNKVMTKGKIWIQCTGAATVAEIKQALIDADVTDVAYIQNNTFLFYGILHSIGTLTFTDFTITCFWGFIGGGANNIQLTYLRCTVHILETHYGSYLGSTATNCNFYIETKGPVGTSNVGYVYRPPIGVNNSFISPWGMGSENMLSSSIIDKMVLTTTNRWYMGCSLSTLQYINCKVFGGNLTVYYINVVPSPSFRLIKGFYIESPGAYDILITNSNTQTKFEIQNIDTARVNNRKIVNTTSTTRITSIYFYRTKTVLIQTITGVPIAGVTFTLTNDAGTVYAYTSDVNGLLTFEILEQTSAEPPSGSTCIETFFDNWTLKASKTGYETYQSFFTYAHNIETVVNLKPIQRLRPAGQHLLIATSPELGSSSPMLKVK
jgi:hypothetical protein